MIAVGGDGDGFAIGGGHFPHAARRNVDITYVIMDNQTYGLTKGQVSPTSLHDQNSPSTPFGNLEEPMNVLATAVAADCSFVARGASFRSKELTELIVEGIRQPGFSFIDAFSPCTAFNNTTQEWKEASTPSRRARPTDRAAAFAAALETRWGSGSSTATSGPRSTAACARCRKPPSPGRSTSWSTGSRSPRGPRPSCAHPTLLAHVDLVVSSLERSLPFYRGLMEQLGGLVEEEVEGERGETIHYLSPEGSERSARRARSNPTSTRCRVTATASACTTWPSMPSLGKSWTRSRAWLQAIGAPIESGPREYDYTPGYYAVFFHDPDWLKLEVLHRRAGG